MKTFSEFLQEDKYRIKAGTWQTYTYGVKHKYNEEKPRARTGLKRKRSFIPAKVKAALKRKK
jgi:hypothetical protein